jgi:GNAT superfamily N-acetyltransferase
MELARAGLKKRREAHRQKVQRAAGSTGPLVVARILLRRTIAAAIGGAAACAPHGHPTPLPSVPSTVASRLALFPPIPSTVEWIARILREGGRRRKLRRGACDRFARGTGLFREPPAGARDGLPPDRRRRCTPSQTAASGYVYTLASASRGAIPIGFTLFKSIGGLGFEVWLVGVDRRFRGKGFGKAMLQAALATPAACSPTSRRVNRAGHDCVAMGKALGGAGYRPERDGPDVRWFVRQDAPQALVRLVREGGARLSEGLGLARPPGLNPHVAPAVLQRPSPTSSFRLRERGELLGATPQRSPSRCPRAPDSPLRALHHT